MALLEMRPLDLPPGKGRVGGGGPSPPGEFLPSPEGILLSAEDLRGRSFPRSRAARLLEEYQEELGAPAPAVEAARRLAREDSLVVVAGQQPLPAGGPLYVLYKAWTALALARRAEALLGRPVIPLFWNASEDHDLEEIGRVGVPAPRGERVLFRAPLERWAGRPASGIPGDREWREAILALLEELPPSFHPGEFLPVLVPREGEGWSRWVSRILSSILGNQGLVLLEPRLLRPLAVPLFARVLEGWEEVRDLLDASRLEKAAGGAKASFPPLEGPPLFLEEEGIRRRILFKDGGFRLKGKEGRWSLDELLARLRGRPGDFSSHAVLRPVVQNSLFPVLAQVVGPGEMSYLEEILRFHASPLGAGRPMPLLWPRLSAVLLDPDHKKTMERFGLEGEDLFLSREDLARKALHGGERAAEIASAKRTLLETLGGTAGRILPLAPTLEAPFRKAADQLTRILERLERKVAAAEEEARGFGPGKIERLARWVRPGGTPQERAFAFFPFLPLLGEEGLAEVPRRLDVFDFRPRLLMVGAAAGRG